jgi:hypothetical protein
MEARPPAETASVRRLRPPAERRALWKSVQRIWRKRATDATDVIAQMRAEWDRESPASKRHEAVYTLDTNAIVGFRLP